MLTFTFQQIADAVAPMLANDPTETDSWTVEPDIWDSVLDRVRDYLGCAAPGMYAELDRRGLAIDLDAETVTLTVPTAMTGARRLIRELTWEYDCTKPRADVPTSWWETLPLSGDDDVDYNGSYLDIGLEPLETLLPSEYQAFVETDAPIYNDYHLVEHHLKGA
jgi:hypothetical protein